MDPDWLERIKRHAFLPYEEAKKVVNALGLKGQDFPEIPSAPWVTYKDSGWNRFADWSINDHIFAL